MVLSNITGIRQVKSLFQVIFLKNDVSQSVWIEEVDEINFSEIKKHLINGESIFITNKQKNKLITSRDNEQTVHQNQIKMKKRKMSSALKNKNTRLPLSMISI